MKYVVKFLKGSPGAILGVLLYAVLGQPVLAGESLTATITPITLPGAASLAVNGLNAAGQVAGYYYDAQGRPRAFLSTNGVLFDIGTLGGVTAAGVALNASGQVAGYSSLAGEAEFHAFVFGERGMADLGTLGGVTSSALAINDTGEVTGYSQINRINLEQHAFLYSGGRMMDLGTLGGSGSMGLAVNRLGQVTGEALTAGDAQTHAFLYRPGTMLDLGTLGGTYSSPNALNNLGQVTGVATTANDAARVAFLFDGTAMVSLGTLGGVYSEGFALNDLGQAAGDSTLAGEADYHGFVYAGGALQDLGTLGGTVSTVWAMNNEGRIVGMATTLTEQERAFVWQKGQMTDLNTLLPAASGWELETASYINDSGQIVGTGTYQGQPSWFFLTLIAQTNSPPVANAGPDQIVACAGENTPVELDGTASRDPDGDALAFEWRIGEVLLGAGAKLNVQVPAGAYTFTLRVTDPAGAAAEDTVDVQVVDTTPPVLSCPANLTVSADARCQAVVPDFLAGLAVTDLCAPAAALVKSQVPAPGTAVALGNHLVTLTVADTAGNRASCSVTLTVADTTPPVITSVTANPAVLTPLNHQMTPVTLSVVATDQCDPSPTCRILSVESSEPPTSQGDNTSPDWVVTGPLTLQLRAESAAKDPSRFYTITVACTDAAGNMATSTVTVETQKNKKPDKPR